MTFHAGFPRVSNHNSTDSSSALLLNLTPTEELDKESVFFDDPVASPSSAAVAASAVNPSTNSRSNRPVLWFQNRVIEDIYEDLCYVNLRIGERNREEDLLQESPWPGLPHDKRDYCIRELAETEKNYIDALNMIIRHFVRPLKTVLSHNDRATIFLNIKDLAEIHRGFHNDLIKACTSPSGKISQVFLSYKEKFVIYGSYCTNLPRSQALLDELCTRNETIHHHVIQCQKAANEGKFKLRDLLSLPMQRILKYHLLLNELIKSTSESHEDFAGLKKAHDAMVDLGQYINEIKRDSETLQIIDDIQRSIVDLEMPENTELKDYGRLVKDGEVKLRSVDNKLKTRYIFLFDKVLLMCKPIRNDQYSYREAPILADYKIVEMGLGTNGNMTASASSTSVSSFLHPKDKFDHGIFLVHRHDPRSGYGFFVKNEETKKLWIEAFNRAYDNVNPEGNSFTNHSFTLHTFTNPYSCSHCSNLLHGLFFQGYKCTICKIGVHKSCIPKVRKCGAPSLPPRPTFAPSTSVPSPSPSVPSLRSSSLSMLNDSRLEETNSSSCGRASLPPSPSDPHFSFPQMASPLEEYQWFVGNMTRETAQAILDRLPHGTFLVRISPKQKGSFAISINYNGHVKHIRICQSEGRYYLSAKKLFDSLVELVEYYATHSLADSFHGLNAYLSNPCKLSCRQYNCSSQANDSIEPASAPILDFAPSDRPSSSQNFSFVSHQRQVSEPSNYKPTED